jgi:hypothetical protein
LFFLLLYGLIGYFLNFRLNADKMFYQPVNKNFASATESRVSAGKLVIGTCINGEAKAFPVEIIGYHHQVRDTVGGVPVMATYCTVCRTGRIYDPRINGVLESFRLVGMDHYNAMFEDQSTKSWWRQATGEAIAGKLKGTTLLEIPSEQMTLANWLRKYPGSLILQPDSLFTKEYSDLTGFDDGTIQSELEYRDFLPWQEKSWVLGIAHAGQAYTYDWGKLVAQRILNDSLRGLHYVIAIEPDSVSFHTWNSTLNGTLYHFAMDTSGLYFRDLQTGSLWNYDGVCVDGALKGVELTTIKSSQEFLHSWEFFHPESIRR